MRCVFCRTSEGVGRAPAYSKPGRWIKESRVFTVPICDADRDIAEQSFDTPFRDREVISLYKQTLEDERTNGN